VIGDVRQIQADDTDESWERDIEVDDGEVRWVGADLIDFAGGWNVHMTVMEFIREEPLEGVLRRRIAAALRSVEGVETAEEMDREVVRHRYPLGRGPSTGRGKGGGRPR
jgi:hypothetical protein